MLLAEDLLLLLTDDETGKAVVDGTALDHALAGAVLLDLALSGHVDVAGPNEAVKEDRLVIRRTDSTNDQVLDEALDRLEAKVGKKPQYAVSPLTKGLRGRLYDRLAEHGIVCMERDKVLGLFPRTRWPAADVDHERRVRTQLRDKLVHGTGDDARTSALIALLSAIDAVPKVIDPADAGMGKRDLRERAKAIAESQWAAEAVRKSVEAANASIMAATTGGAAVAAVAGS